MKVLGVIPARYASTRFPGKALAMIHGKPMVQWVYEKAMACTQLEQVIVATDHPKIVAAVEAFGGEVMLTSDSHQSGTDRCAEVARKTSLDFDVLVNIQGDEPSLNPLQLDEILEVFKNPNADIATLMHPLEDLQDLNNPNVVKVVCSKKGKALYFSRAGIPFVRGTNKTQHYKHIGLYAYKKQALEKITLLPPSKLEVCESLEQLRWLENDLNIFVNESKFHNIGIDTPEQLNEFLKKTKHGNE